jgi:hypothetical protein
VLGFAGAGGVAVAAAIFVDTPGRILLGAAAVALLAEALVLVVVRPILTITDEGLAIRRGGRTHHYPWGEVGAVQARAARRLVMVRTLDIDLGEALVVIPAYRIGRDPAEVAAAIEDRRPVSA